VVAARKRQAARYGGLEGGRVRTNADCPSALLEEAAALDKAGAALLAEAAESLKLSARGYHRNLKLARTLADLDGADSVGRLHVAEALSYRGETLRAREAA